MFGVWRQKKERTKERKGGLQRPALQTVEPLGKHPKCANARVFACAREVGMAVLMHRNQTKPGKAEIDEYGDVPVTEQLWLLEAV